MSKAEILNELPKQALGELREIFERIGELEKQGLLKGGEPTAEEKALLDRELEEFHQSPQAGATWAEVETRLRNPARS